MMILGLGKHRVTKKLLSGNFVGARPPGNVEALLDTRSGSASEAPQARRCGPFRFAWMRERAARLHQAFSAAEQRIAQGRKVTHVLDKLAAQWGRRGRYYYRCRPSKELRYCRSSILRLYYQWKWNGKTPDSLALHYKPMESPSKRAAFRVVCAIAADPTVSSYRQAIPLSGKRASVRACVGVLPEPVRRLLTALLRARREQRRATAALMESLRDWGSR